MNTLGLQASDINTEGMLLSLFAFPSSFPFLSLPSLTYDWLRLMLATEPPVSNQMVQTA